MSTQSFFASRSIAEHLERGVIGVAVLVAAVALTGIVGPVSLVLAPLALVAWRGCPTCWAVGLAETISASRLRRDCADGRCAGGEGLNGHRDRGDNGGRVEVAAQPQDPPGRDRHRARRP